MWSRHRNCYWFNWSRQPQEVSNASRALWRRHHQTVDKTVYDCNPASEKIITVKYNWHMRKRHENMRTPLKTGDFVYNLATRYHGLVIERARSGGDGWVILYTYGLQEAHSNVLKIVARGWRFEGRWHGKVASWREHKKARASDWVQHLGKSCQNLVPRRDHLTACGTCWKGRQKRFWRFEVICESNPDMW